VCGPLRLGVQSFFDQFLDPLIVDFARLTTARQVA